LIRRSLLQPQLSQVGPVLSKPLLWVFHIDLSTQLFADFYRALQNIRPSTVPAPPEWKLDKVLFLLMLQKFVVNPSLVNATMKVLFLLTLATGGRINEINALLCGDAFLKFF